MVEVGVRSLDSARGAGFFSSPRNLLSEGPRAPRRLKRLHPFRAFGPRVTRRGDDGLYITSRHRERYSFEKPAGTFRIVCFGGSTTEQLVDGVHYPLLLQQRLRAHFGRDDIEVISVANSAYATPHSLALLSFDVLSWSPDLLILSHNVNDLTAMYWPGFVPDYSNKYAHRFFSAPDVRGMIMRDRALRSLANQVFQHSEVYWLVRELLGMNSSGEAEGSGKYKPIRRYSYGMEPDPLASSSYERNLRSFVTLAETRGIDVILATQPLFRHQNGFDFHMSFKPYNDIVEYPLHEEFLSHHDAYNEILSRVAREEGAGLVDNDARLAGELDYFLDFVHYQRAGMDEVTSGFFEHIVSSGLIDRAGR
jgi:lysophospholipase L1-like esterase